MSSYGESPTVRDLLLDRLATGSVPGGRSDEFKLVLAVEGGGMRGAVSSGMLLALEQLGLRNSFDEVVGTSAGAIAGAFFAIGEGTKGSVLYYTVLNSERFVDRRRLFRSGSVLDLDFLIKDAFERHGFSWEKLVHCDIPLWATVSPALPGNPHRLFRVGETVEHAQQVLAASASLPVIAGPSRLVGADLYVDGGMLEPVPWFSALQLGATHVLVARSRRFIDHGGPEPPNLFERTAVPRLVRRMHGEHVGHLVDQAPERFWFQTESLRAVVCGEAQPITDAGQGAAVIDVVLPSPETDLPDRLEIDRHLLMDALTAGAQAMVDHLDIEGFTVEQRVVVNHPRAPVGRMRSDALSPILATRRQISRH